MVLDYLFVWPPMERRGEFAAASLQTESYLEREHNARWTVLGVGYATRGVTANLLTLLLPRSILARDQLNPYLQGAQGKTWNNGNRVPITMSGFTKEQYMGVMQMLDLDATPQEGMIFHSGLAALFLTAILFPFAFCTIQISDLIACAEAMTPEAWRRNN